MTNEISDKEVMDQLTKLANTTTVPDEKHNVHAFLDKVATSKDTTKVGYLKEEEVGIPKLSQRTLKELELYSRSIADKVAWADFFAARAEILTSTSLSKDAKLLELAVITRSQTENVTKPRKVNKSWFKRKQPESTTL